MKRFSLVKILIALIFSKSVVKGELTSLAQFIKDGLDVSINPCNNLYGYVCGSSERKLFGFNAWSSKNWIDLTFYSKIKELYNRKNILEGDENKNKLNMDITWVDACINENDIEKTENFKSYINTIGAWPMISEVKTSKSWQKIETSLVRLQGRSTFFYLDNTNIGFEIKIPLERDSFEYIKTLKDNLKMLSAIELLKSDLNNNNCPLEDDKDLLSEIENLQNFQNGWMMIVNENDLGSCKKINLMDLQESITKFLTDKQKGKINWSVIFEAMFENTDLEISTIDVCANIKYWEEFSLYLSETPNSVIVNYIYTSLVLNKIEILQEPDSDSKDRLDKCIDNSPLIDGFLSELVNTPEIEAKKDYVTNMFEEIRKQYEIEINKSWIYTELRTTLIEKLKKMKIYFPISNSNNADDPIFLNDVSYDFKITKSFVNNLFNFRKAQTELKAKMYQQIRKLGSSLSAIDNAYYFHAINSVVVPAVYIFSHYIDVNNPISMNYGVIGFIIAHEIGHGLDLEDYSDEIKNSNSDTSGSYFNYKDCLRDQMKEYGVNFTATYEENYADAVGMKIALNTLKRIICEGSNKHQEITELDCKHWKRLFFISFPTYFCEQPVKKIYDGEKYPPTFIRINYVPSNSYIFEKEYDCQSDHDFYKMSPCYIWSEP